LRGYSKSQVGLLNHQANPGKLSLGQKGHDVGKFLHEILYHDHISNNIDFFPLAREGFRYLNNVGFQTSFITIISEYGLGGRYTRLDKAAGRHSTRLDPDAGLHEFEKQLLEQMMPGYERILAISAESHKVMDFLVFQIQSIIEKIVRAIARFYTSGLLGSEGKQLSPLLKPFYKISDDELGLTSY